MSQTPTVTLNSGARIPQLGFGVFQVPPDEVFEPVRTAIEAGYRSIDTAAAYGNEEGVGRAIAESGVARQELFVTTKLWNDQQGYDETLRAFDASLNKLGLDYVDLYLIHWPAPGQDLYIDTWKAFEKLHADGRAKSIGVSNFQIPHLRRVLEETDVVPAVNQIELHPNLQQPDLRAFHTEHGITTEAWSPIGQGKGLLEDTTLTSLADKYGKTPAQIVLRWHMQLGNVAIPKSVTPSRVRENLDVFDFEIAEDDMKVIAGLETGTRVGPDPDVFGA
ncbi:diketogulonate reductase-like aldo/keto reductase [Halopolyspora algeriensis]|uniref:Diketogulonate reductase-like aldo/keto reductase n=1 Tax=Halopolyspora algeriensis TaxID=1500506 RepID=A0A368VYJ0_9ACTN|nr:aldo/keto reductase [Halopolyspora algeriensis]RCW46985.1 diketogulonate reductase-like aldo/keto reductase [Halopolyspora algeriensis]TQM48074.1 diketogulonate reductase-like aldo/keto reductase [Halopolyspora algeriensis]